MYCCINCFADEEIRDIIQSANIKDTCDFCGSHNTYVYDIGTNSVITELFDPLLDIYTPISLLPHGFPHQHTGLIKDILCHDWQIFNLPPDVIYKLITVLCADRYKEQPDLFNHPIGIPEIQNIDYLKAHSILKGYKWADFDAGIKTKNRFHSSFINTDKLDSFLQCVIETYHKGKKMMFRSRICPTKEGFKPSKMGAPPNHAAKDGRVKFVQVYMILLP